MTTTPFITQSGQQYDIDVTDGSEILVTKNGEKCGSIVLSYREGDGQMIPDTYHITNLGLEDCKGQGVGRRCLELHKENFGEPLTAGSSHSGKQDDGSHLTGDGPGFIEKMREEGIVCRERNYDDPRDYEFE
jgi:hypothetical protein